MELTFAFAKFFGLYMIIMGGALLFRPKELMVGMKALMEDPAQSLAVGIFGIILGIFLVVFHTVWVAHWAVVITILCWWTLIKCTLWVYFPKEFGDWSKGFMEKVNFKVYGGSVLGIGVVLLLLGFGFGLV